MSGQPRPLVRAVVDAVNTALTAPPPGHGLSALQRAWLACCLTALLGPQAVGWARFARASLGPYALAALAWRFRHATMPWAWLLVARVRVLRRHDGIPPGRLVGDDRATPRAQSAKKLADLHHLRENESGGGLLGQRLGFLLLVTPTITLPLGVAFSLPAPELTAWDTPERPLQQPGLPRKRRPPTPPSTPP